MNQEAFNELLYGKLGFCGCGEPTEALTFLRDVLRLIKKRGDIWLAPQPDTKEAKEARDAQVSDISDDLNTILHYDGGRRGLYYWFLYWLNHNELAEHGGSVGGSWLTEKGKEVLAYLEENDIHDILND